MSDSASVSSTGSSSLGPDPELPVLISGSNGRPAFHTRKSRSDSASRGSQDSGTATADDAPSKESIGAALDKYVTASKEGREAFNMGNLRGAVREFNQALDIELQTELDCLYDTSIGMVSGLVRKEVDSRLDMQGRYLGSKDTPCTRCTKIMEQLKDLYQDAAHGMKSKKRSSSPEWYLKMGATLIVINEWEKAKAVYTEGINMCRDKKRLKIALKNLIKIEQMTSYGEIPAEDQPDQKELSPKVSPTHSASPQIQLRNRSGSMGTSALREVKKSDFKRERTASLNLESHASTGNGVHLRANSAQYYSPPIMKREKRLSFGLFGFRRSSAGSLLSSRNPSLTSPEELQQWKECFDPTNCRVLNQSEFQPLAITHMRRLASAGGEEDVETDLDFTKLNTSCFTAVNQKSLVIEDDDSELEDFDD